MNRTIDLLASSHLHHARPIPILVAAMLAMGCPGDDGAGEGTDTTGEDTSATGTTAPTSTTDVTGSDTDATSAGVDSTGEESSTGEDVNPLERVYEAIGGREALEQWSTLSMQSQGTRWEPGEALDFEAPRIEASQFDLQAGFDVPNRRARFAYERMIVNPLVGAASYVETIDHEVGFITGNDNIIGIPERPMVSARITSAMRQQWLLNPHFYLRAVALGDAGVEVAGTEDFDGREHDVIVVEDELAPVELLADAQTGLISQLRTQESDFLLGDVSIEVDYLDWDAPDAGPLWFPATVAMRLDGADLHDEQRSSVMVDESIDESDFDIPAKPMTVVDPADAQRGNASAQWFQRVVSIGIPLEVTQGFVDPIEISPGVHLLAGGSHNSLAVEMDDSVVLVDAPLYEERSIAIRDTLAMLYPAKPVSHVITTHYHFDHLGGIRTFISDGAMIVGEIGNEPYLQSVAERPHTLVPDELEASGTGLTFEGVTDSFTVSDATNTVEAHWVDSVHGSDILVVFLPNEGLLFNSDLYSPGLVPIEFAPLPEPQLSWATDLYDGIELLGLNVQFIAGGHGGVAPYADLLTHIGQ